MTVSRLINDKKDYFFKVSAAYLIVLLIFSVIGDRGLVTSFVLWSNQKQHQKDISLLEAEVEMLAREVHMFTYNDRRLYEYARETFNMQQENEVQYVFGKRH